MFPSGIIEKINKYYLEEPRRKREFERALAEFFETDSAKDLAGMELTEQYLGLTNEWFIFDYKHTNGRTTLEDYLAENKRWLTAEEINLLESLLQTSRYGMFEVRKIDVGKGLELHELQSGDTYKIRERKATYSLSAGNLLAVRIGQVGGQWELVGAPGISWPLKLGEGAREFFKGSKERLNPKVIFRLLASAGDEEMGFDIYVEENPSPESAKSRLQELLRLHDLDKYLNVGVIERWCRDAGRGKRTPMEIISLTAGMAGEAVSLQVLRILLKAVLNFYNTRPQKFLFGKSPQEKSLEAGFGSEGFLAEAAEIGGKKFFDVVKEAHALMGKGNYHAAVAKFDESFNVLLKQKTTKPDIYRLYANAAVAHFGAGMETEGKILLEKSLELNSNYDFAIMTKEKYEQGEFDSVAWRGRVEQLRQLGKNLGRWDFDAIRQQWSEDKVLEQLAAYGIKLTRSSFLAAAKKYFATRDFSEAELYPQYTGPDDWNEDFVWMAAYGLWERWGAELPAHDILTGAFTNLSGLLFEDYGIDSSVEESLGILENYLRISNSRFIAAWQDSNHYRNDVAAFMESAVKLLDSGERQRILDIAGGYKKLTGDDFWQLADILDKIIKNEEGGQECLVNLANGFPYAPLPYLLAAGVFSGKKDYGAEENYLLKALTVVEKREREQPEILTHYGNDVLADYEHVLSALENFYKERDQKEKLKEIKSRLSGIERRQDDDANCPERLEELGRLVEEVDKQVRRRLASQPAIKYYDYIQGLGINFKTDELTKSEITVHGFGGKHKIGRNDPCPCGGGKKYKKCHGQ